MSDLVLPTLPSGIWRTFRQTITRFPRMDLYVIAGVIIIAAGTGIGTFLTIFGGQRQSRKDSAETSAEVVRELAEFRRELHSAVGEARSPEVAAKVESIDRDFSAWARSVLNNQERVALELEENRLGMIRRKLDVSDRVRPAYVHFLSSLKKAINAYNAASGEKITANIPELPSNLFAQKPAYKGTVSFGHGVTWEITLDPPIDLSSFLAPMPALSIRINDPRDSSSTSEVTVAGFDLTNEVNVRVNGNRLPRLKGLEGGTYIREYKQGMETAAMKLVEAQVTALRDAP